jgi:hypothetical protein
MLSLELELGLPLSGCFYSLGNDCKGPRSIARVLDRGQAKAAETLADGWESLSCMISASVSIASGVNFSHKARTSGSRFGRPPGLPLTPFGNGLPLPGILGCSFLLSAKTQLWKRGRGRSCQRHPEHLRHFHRVPVSTFKDAHLHHRRCSSKMAVFSKVLMMCVLRAP